MKTQSKNLKLSLCCKLLIIGLLIVVLFGIQNVSAAVAESYHPYANNEDETWTIFGKEINNRKIIPLILGIMCVVVEIMLNFYGLLIWEHWWWNWYFPFLQVFVYSAPMYITTWIYDKDDLVLLKRGTPIIAITAIALFALLVGLGWI